MASRGPESKVESDANIDNSLEDIEAFSVSLHHNWWSKNIPTSLMKKLPSYQQYPLQEKTGECLVEKGLTEFHCIRSFVCVIEGQEDLSWEMSNTCHETERSSGSEELQPHHLS